MLCGKAAVAIWNGITDEGRLDIVQMAAIARKAADELADALAVAPARLRRDSTSARGRLNRLRGSSDGSTLRTEALRVFGKFALKNTAIR